MAGKKISQLPIIAAPALTDILPAVQSGATGQETWQAVLSLFLANLGTIPSLTVTALTAGTITFNPTTGGIVGTTTNDNAAAGKVGEYISSSVLVGSAVSLTTATPANITSISLTAGDWDISGTVLYAPASSTTSSYQLAGITQTSATFETDGANNNNAGVGGTSGSLGAGYGGNLCVGTYRASLASTKTIYLIAQAGFAVSTLSAYGYIAARRAR